MLALSLLLAFVKGKTTHSGKQSVATVPSCCLYGRVCISLTHVASARDLCSWLQPLLDLIICPFTLWNKIRMVFHPCWFWLDHPLFLGPCLEVCSSPSNESSSFKPREGVSNLPRPQCNHFQGECRRASLLKEPWDKMHMWDRNYGVGSWVATDLHRICFLAKI